MESTENQNIIDQFEKLEKKVEQLIRSLALQEETNLELVKKIESLEDLKGPKDKLQLLYLIYRIIHFFYLEDGFNLSHLKDYLENEIDEWLMDIPLITLKNPDLYVVIGNPNSGSIGKETKKILTAADIFGEVMDNAKELTTDSKRLVSVLKKDEADLVINWYATSTWEENALFIDAISIDENLAKKKRLMLGLLITSKYPDIAAKFMDYAVSTEGQKIFDRYGLYQIDGER